MKVNANFLSFNQGQKKSDSINFLYNIFYDIYKRKESFEYYGLDTDNEKNLFLVLERVK